MGRAARPPVEPHRGSRPPERRRPLGAQPTTPEQRLGLPATRAPRRGNGAPAVTAHVAHQPGGIAEREEGAAQQALGWEEELLDGLTHQARGSRRHASPRAAPPHPRRRRGTTPHPAPPATACHGVETPFAGSGGPPSGTARLGDATRALTSHTNT